MKSVFNLINKDRWIIPGLALLILCLNAYTTMRCGSDELVQLGTVVNFLQGEGFTLLQTNDGNIIENIVIEDWPYAYRIISVPFVWVTGGNIDMSFVLVLCLSYLVLFVVVGKIFRELGGANHLFMRNISFLYFALNISPVKFCAEIDLFTASLFLYGILILYRYIKKEDTPARLFGIMTVILLLPHFRYAYLAKSLALFGLLALLLMLFSKPQKYIPILAVGAVLWSLNTYWITSASYFQETAAHIVQTGTTTETVPDAGVSYWLYYYAPAFNSFFPDFIIFSFIKSAAPGLYAKGVFGLAVVFAFLSLLILGMMLSWFIKTYFPLKKEKLREQLLPFLLFAAAGINLLFLLAFYRLKTIQPEGVYSGSFFYTILSVTNRYFALFHLSIFILAVYFAFSLQKRFFQMVLISGLFFGGAHAAYLRTVFSTFDRMKNMDIVNLPVGSYNDSRHIGSLVNHARKENTKTIYVHPIGEKAGDANRQIKPGLFLRTTGAVWTTVPFIPQENQRLFLSVRKGEKLPDLPGNFIPVYEGKVYDLFELTAYAQ